MEPDFQDPSCTLNTWQSIPEIAGFITVYLVAVSSQKFIAVYKKIDAWHKNHISHVASRKMFKYQEIIGYLLPKE